MLPIYTGEPARRALASLWGIPNACPSRLERDRLGVLAYLNTRRLLFVDDDDHGRPIAIWEPR